MLTMWNQAKRIFDAKSLTLLGVIVVLCIVFAIASPYFLTEGNLLTVLRSVAILGVIAVGQTVIFLIAGVDISVGANTAFTGCVVAFLMTVMHVHPALSILLGLLLATVVGMTSGTIVAKLGIVALITTLGMSQVLRGLAYVLTGGVPFYGLPADYGWIASGYILGVLPVPVLFTGIVFALGYVFLQKSYLGRRVYALGGNPEATRLAGVNTSRLTIASFGISGFLAGVGGVMLLFRINSGQPNAGLEYDLDSITAVALGGISLAGGQGRLLGVALGVLIIGIMDNGLVLMNVGDYWQMAIKGVILIFALAVDNISQRRSEARLKAAA